MSTTLMRLVALIIVLLVPSHAGAIVSDYFTAHEDFEVARDLMLIEGDHTNRVLRWIRSDRINMAIADVKFTLDRFPNHPRALLLMETVARVSKVPELPLPYYEHALKMFPGYAVTHAQYGRYLAEIGKVQDGLEQLNAAAKISPDYAATFVWLAEVYSKTGEAHLAEQATARARELGYRGEIVAEPSETLRRRSVEPDASEPVKRKKAE